MTYLDWLKSQVEYFDSAGRHDFLFNRLNQREYYALINRDQNRVEDGLCLRDEFDTFSSVNYPEEDQIVDGPCSFLEFLVALVRRMNFIYARVDEDCTQDLFWELLSNIDLDSMEDEVYFDFGGDLKVDEALDTILERRYSFDGQGNIFPLKNPRHNQTNVEVWYQMNQYITEKLEAEGR